MKILKKDFYGRTTEIVAQDLLGKILIREHKGITMKARIVETEAYTSLDPACHAYRGKTQRTAPLFGQVGYTYVYFIYGNHYCLNIVARDSQTPAGGVLIRGVEPIEGIEVMQQYRAMPLHNLTNGPGKLTQALAIDKELVCHNAMEKGSIYIVDEGISSFSIESSSRIGISAGIDKQWRFFIAGNTYVSG